MKDAAPLLSVKNLTKHFPVTRGVLGRQVATVRAVDGISFELWPGETLGLVGESGCGKTTAGRSILGLIEPSSGNIEFEGTDLVSLSARELRARRRDMQIIFQDPFSSLNPRMRVRDIIGESLVTHKVAKGREVDTRVAELLERVGVSKRFSNRYPHEFSGGQRQRIGIARAIALSPKFIVCDEAVSALDVSIRAQVLNLLLALREELSLSYLFISHDLSVVRHISSRIAVMYLGQIVELADADELFQRPAHPYTRSLLSAIPLPDPRQKRQRVVLSGDVPTPMNPPSGCRFHTRCPAVFERCPREEPALVVLGSSHTTRCHHADGLDGRDDWFSEFEARVAAQERRNAETAVHAKSPDVETATPPATESAARQAREREKEAGLLARDTPLIGRRAARALVLLGLSLVVAGYWLVGALIALFVYAGRLRKELERRLASDLGIAALLSLSLLLSDALMRQERTSRAHRELRGLAAQLTAYRSNVGAYPESLSELDWRLFEVLPDGELLDPWGRAYGYRLESDKVRGELFSHGPDQDSAADDLSVTLP